MMNIFYLDQNPKTCAHMHCDKHVVKMILEYAQLMSTAHHILDGDDAVTGIYKCTHKNHPSAVWTRQSSTHYYYVLNLFKHLGDEYSFRYGKNHLTVTKLQDILESLPKNIHASQEWVDPPQCMPDMYKADDTVKAYRTYYKHGKDQAWITKFTNRNAPDWLLAQTPAMDRIY